MLISKPLATLAVLVLLAGQAARADTVDVTSTTLLRLGQETRGGQPPGKPELDTVAPVFEILSISAHGVRNPVLDDLAIVVTTWGSYDIADRRWDNGTGSNATGDVVTGYLQGKLAGRRLTLRLGREHVMTGAARMIHLDGAEAIAALPFGLRLSAYGGSPVTQRFTTRRAIRNWNPVGGDVAYGGRASWAYAIPGAAGRGVELGASANVVTDGGDPVRQEAAVDLRLQPISALSVTGFGAYSLYDERASELSVRATYAASRALLLEADARHVAPDLLLARNSILSVFSAEERRSFGAGASYRFGKAVLVGGSYHLDLEPGEREGDSDYLGQEAEARLEWERGRTLAGVEVLFLDALENGYLAGRLFGRQDYGKYFAAVDVFTHFFREEVNGEPVAVTGALTGGVSLARGFSAVVSGRAGMTPFLEQTFDVMAKLVYNATYRVREVR
jgi:hypothetical protein